MAEDNSLPEAWSFRHVLYKLVNYVIALDGVYYGEWCIMDTVMKSERAYGLEIALLRSPH